jgi:hypothetical protein
VIRQAPIFRCTNWGIRPPASAGIPPRTAPEASGPKGLEPEATTPPRPEAAPQEEAARPAAATEAPVAAPGVEAGPSPAEPATEGAAATAEAAAPEAAEAAETAAPEVAEVASTAAPPAEEEEPEVVLGRRLLPSTAEIPLPRLFAKCQQAQEELEAYIRREWEKLEAEHLRLSDWEHRLGDRIKFVSARYADERVKLVLERELLQEQLQQAPVREAAACQRERAATRREAQALEREIAAEEKILTAADKEQTALELADQAKRVATAIKAEETILAELVAAAAKKEEWLAAREAEEVALTADTVQDKAALGHILTVDTHIKFPIERTTERSSR